MKEQESLYKRFINGSPRVKGKMLGMLVVATILFILTIGSALGAITDDVLVHYDFEGDFLDADSTLGAYNCTNTGLNFTSAVIDNGTQNTGGNNYATCDQPSVPNANNPYVWNAWVKITGDPANSNRYADFYTTRTAGLYFGVEHLCSASPFSGSCNESLDTIQFKHLQSDSQYEYVRTPLNTIDRDIWYMVTAEYNTTHMNLYINGTLVNSTPETTVIGTGTSGAYIFNDNSNRHIVGEMDEMTIWYNTTLPQSNLTYLYNNSCAVALYGGTSNFCINNTAPSITNLSISPTTFRTLDNLTTSYTFTDAENDTDTSIIEWYVNGNLTYTGSTLNYTNFIKGDNVTVVVTPNDGTVNGTAVNSSGIVANTNAVMSNFFKTDGNPYGRQTFRFQFDYYDPDVLEGVDTANGDIRIKQEFGTNYPACDSTGTLDVLSNVDWEDYVESYINDTAFNGLRNVTISVNQSQWTRPGYTGPEVGGCDLVSGTRRSEMNLNWYDAENNWFGSTKLFRVSNSPAQVSNISLSVDDTAASVTYDYSDTNDTNLNTMSDQVDASIFKWYVDGVPLPLVYGATLPAGAYSSANNLTLELTPADNLAAQPSRASERGTPINNSIDVSGINAPPHITSIDYVGASVSLASSNYVTFGEPAFDERDNVNGDYMAQSFQSGSSTVAIDRIKAQIFKYSGAGANYYVRVVEDYEGVPSSILISPSCEKLQPHIGGLGQTTQYITFADTCYVPPNTDYWVVFYGDYYTGVYYDYDNTITQGVALRSTDSGDTWSTSGLNVGASADLGIDISYLNNTYTTHWSDDFNITATAADGDGDDVYYEWKLFENDINTENSTFIRDVSQVTTFPNPLLNSVGGVDTFYYGGQWHAVLVRQTGNDGEMYGYTLDTSDLWQSNNTILNAHPYNKMPTETLAKSYKPEFYNYNGTLLYAEMPYYTSNPSTRHTVLWSYNGTAWNDAGLINSTLVEVISGPDRTDYGGGKTLFELPNEPYLFMRHNSLSPDTIYKWNGIVWSLDDSYGDGMPYFTKWAKVYYEPSGRAVVISDNPSDVCSIRSSYWNGSDWIVPEYITGMEEVLEQFDNNNICDLKGASYYEDSNGKPNYFISFLGSPSSIGGRWAVAEGPEFYTQNTTNNIYEYEQPQTPGTTYHSIINAHDFLVPSTQVLLGNITITNTLPTATDVNISPTNASDVDNLTGSYDYFDADGDSEGTTTTYWWVEDMIVAINQSTLDSGNFAGGDTVVWQVIPNDGAQDGTQVNKTITIISSRDAPTVGTRQLQNMAGTPQNNLLDLLVTTNYRWYASNFTHNNITAPGATLTLNITTINGSTVLVNEEYDATNVTEIYSSYYEINDYRPYHYAFTIRDETNLSTTYEGTLQAQNQAPIITQTQTYRSGVASSCQASTNCELRFIMDEDGCSLAPQVESMIITTPSNGTIINDTNFQLVYETGGNCQFKGDQFDPPTTGTYSWDITFTDFGGLTDTASGTFSVSPATQSPPPVLSGPGGGTGGVVEEIIIIKTDINKSYQIVPIEDTVTVKLGGRYNGEFQVVNDGILDLKVDLSINQELTDQEILDWISFDGAPRIDGLTISAGQGLSSNTKFIRYEIDSKRIIPTGTYTAVIDIEAGDDLRRHTINVVVVESVWAQWDLFWNAEIFPLGTTCTTDTTQELSPVNETVMVSTVSCTPKFILRTKHLIGAAFLILIIVMIGVRMRSSRKKRRND